MALIRWEPARELGTIQSEMNRLFNTFFDTPTTGQANGGLPRRWIPAVDLVETEGQFVLKADLPGLTDDDIRIELEDNVLSISGERKTEQQDRNDGYVRLERSYGSFRRSLTLPEGVDANAITANFDSGVLEVRVPKPEERKPHKVEISVGGSEPRTIEGAETAGS